MKKILNWLFLVKEIKSKEGEVHFRRYRLLWTPLFSIYLHNILKSDEDKHLHSHPWDYTSIILRGGYTEFLARRTNLYDILLSFLFSSCPDPFQTEINTFKPFSMVRRKKEDYHKISLLSPTWTLVWTGRRNESWGYLVNNEHVDHETYRKNKNEGKYDD